MTRNLTRTNFHSSNFIRFLADLALVNDVEATDAFAEKLGQWIHFADAITLSAVHSDDIAKLAKVRRGQEHDAVSGAKTELERVQSVLKNSIVKSFSSNTGRALIELPTPDSEMPFKPAAAFAPYRRFYEAHQRDMDMSIQALRDKLRAAVAKSSPRLKKLAELDETFEKILRDRESLLLAKVPVLLKAHFEKLFKAHEQNLKDTQQIENRATWTKSGGWLARFYHEMQTLLLAELELRLQPAMGLLDALQQDTP